MDELKYPYDDDYLHFDESRNQYVLTRKALTDYCAIDIEGRLGRWGAVRAENIINRILLDTTIMVYDYLYQFNDSIAINYVIATTPSVRTIILDALTKQAVHYIERGDLSNSLKKEEREIAISPHVKKILNKNIEELGCPLTYTGRYV